MLAACLAVALLGCSCAAALQVSSPRLRENQLDFAQQDQNVLKNSSGPERVAGYFQLSRRHTDKAEMFYFFFEARNNSDTAPLAIWLTGGPGCSSELAVFKENGPYSINSDGEVEERKYAWDVEANMIFVDSPLNVGFSYSEDPDDRVTTEEGVAGDLLDFLEEFQKARPHLANRDFYVTGESYAGHYVPAVAAHIYRTNQNKDPSARINLKGIAIGNGLTDPGNQYGSYAPFAEAKGLISSGSSKAIQLTWPICKAGIAMCNSGVPLTCDLSLYYCQATQFAPIVAMSDNANIYDIRKKCVGPLCYDFSQVDDYLNRPDVRKKLGVPKGRAWQECNMNVNAEFMGDFMRSYAAEVTYLLESGLPVLIYSGLEDLICNSLSQHWWTSALEWHGHDAFNAASKEDWRVDGDLAGFIRRAKHFANVEILDAGHMVPMDQPKRMLSLFGDFVRGHLFDHTPKERPQGGKISWKRNAVTQ
jgi:carboxypeptidase C (cathepsin A)